MTPSRLAELRELDKKRTTPWSSFGAVLLEAGGCCGSGPQIETEDGEDDWNQAENDSAFICALVNAAPALLDLWEACRVLELNGGHHQRCALYVKHDSLCSCGVDAIQDALKKLEGPK